MNPQTARTVIFLFLFLVAYFGIFSIPADDSSSWFADFFISKAIGFSAIYGMYRIRTVSPETNKKD